MFVIMRPPYQTDIDPCEEPNGFCTKIIILTFTRLNSSFFPVAAPEQHHSMSSGKTMDLECCCVKLFLLLSGFPRVRCHY